MTTQLPKHIERAVHKHAAKEFRLPGVRQWAAQYGMHTYDEYLEDVLRIARLAYEQGLPVIDSIAA